MSYILFVDESGHDLGEAPYQVLAGLAIQDRLMGKFINALHAAEEECFSGRYTKGPAELKGKKLLKRKVFRQAGQLSPIPNPRRAELARRCLEHGEAGTKEQITALAQAKLEFVRQALLAAIRFNCKCFASIVHRDAPRPAGDYLRKDYSYLFERFFYYLEDKSSNEMGIIVFDEFEKSRSHILVDQMYRYFRDTQKGRQRSSRIIPEPFFVHSDLTTGIQIADLAAYLINWGARVHSMAEPKRAELDEFGQLVLKLRHHSTRWVGLNPRFKIWSLCIIDDLRPKEEREAFLP